MNKTVELVNRWAAFEEKHPNGSMDDFFRLQLTGKQRNKGKMVGGVVPGIRQGLLLKIIGRLAKLNFFYASLALEGTGLNHLEEFGILLSIQDLGLPRKIDVLNDSLFEVSSGSDILTRLRKRGFITEHADKNDKRSKRVKITNLGKSIINKCKVGIVKNASMILSGMPPDDIDICIQLLKNTEIQFSAAWPRHKGMSFDEVYKEVAGERKPVIKPKANEQYAR
jgi:DNA-binding MarR family transcriptional regulator